ncbi:hypothetical protein DVH05_023026 [Phytophthora capsici]|nr:hypothetical protein DVH05_023026 [Phytophthora capsici]
MWRRAKGNSRPVLCRFLRRRCLVGRFINGRRWKCTIGWRGDFCVRWCWSRAGRVGVRLKRGDDDASVFSGDVTLGASARSTSGSVYMARGASSEGAPGGVTLSRGHLNGSTPGSVSVVGGDSVAPSGGSMSLRDGSCGGDLSVGGSVSLERDSASANSGSITVSTAAVTSARSSGKVTSGFVNADSGASGSLSAVSGVCAIDLSGDVVVASGAVSDTDTDAVAIRGGSSGGSRARRYSVVVSSGEIGVVSLSSGVYRYTFGGVTSLVTGGSTDGSG